VSSSGSGDSQPSVSTELCNIVRDHFAENSTVGGVAQSVVDKIVRMHRENFEQTEGAIANMVNTYLHSPLPPWQARHSAIVYPGSTKGGSITVLFSFPWFILHEQCEQSESSEVKDIRKGHKKIDTHLHMDGRACIFLSVCLPVQIKKLNSF